MVFTTESKLLERFAQGDDLIVSSFEFTPLPEPTTADKPQVAAENDAVKKEGTQEATAPANEAAKKDKTASTNNQTKTR